MNRNQKFNKFKDLIDEEIIIEKYLKKLNFSKKTTFDFKNDASIIQIKNNKEIVVSQDTLLENTHFFNNDSPDSIAIKSIRTNLSDLASMGAKPLAYTMSLSLSNKVNHLWLKKFTNSLFKEQKKYNFYLLGGDIIKSKYLSISITIFGVINKGSYILRTSSKLYDDIWLTGNIGNSYIGYLILKKKLYIKNKKIKKFFINSYHFPNPPVLLSNKLSKLMNSAIDVSDGFYGDLKKITINNLKGAVIFINKIPFSRNLITLLKNKKISMEKILSGGDDYQLIFTSDYNNRSSINKLSKHHKFKITRIGYINNGKEIDFQGYNLNKLTKSYVHKI